MQKDRRVVHETRLARVAPRVGALDVEDGQRAHGRPLRDVLRRRGLDSVPPAETQGHPLAVVLPLDVVGRLQTLGNDALHVHGGGGPHEDVLVAVDADAGN